MSGYIYYPNDALKIAKPVFGPVQSTVKPAPWPLSPTLVDPMWGWFWDACVMAIPIWEIDAVPVAYAGGEQITAQAGSRVANVRLPYGQGPLGSWLDTSGVETAAWRFRSPKTVQDIFQGDHAIAVLLWEDDPVTGTGKFLTAGDATQWFAMQGNVSAYGFDGIWDDDGSKIQVVGTKAINDGEPHLCVMQRSGSNYQLWLDGDYDTQSAVNNDYSIEENIYIGGAQWEDGGPDETKIIAVYLFGRALTENEQLWLAAQPFGPFWKVR